MTGLGQAQKERDVVVDLMARRSGHPFCKHALPSHTCCALFTARLHVFISCSVHARTTESPDVLDPHRDPQRQHDAMQVPGDDPALDAESQAPLLLGIAYGMLVPTLAAVAIRLYTRFAIQKAPGADDALIAIAAVCFA